MTGSEKWSDAVLRTVVAEQRSWRGVARAVGYSPTSTGALRVIKQRVLELGLDTGHFTAQRRWSDQQLRESVAASSNWTEVAARLGRGSGEAVASMKGHAARLGLDVSHLGAPTRRGSMPMRNKGAAPGRLRDAAAAVAAAWFQLRSFAVSVPIEPEPYDLVVGLPEGLRRVQVKSGTSKGAHGGWLIGVGHRPAFLDKTAGHVCYDPDDVDYYFIIDGDAEMYLIPGAELAGRTKIDVQGYRQFRVGSAASLLKSCVDVQGRTEQGGKRE